MLVGFFRWGVRVLLFVLVIVLPDYAYTWSPPSTHPAPSASVRGAEHLPLVTKTDTVGTDLNEHHLVDGREAEFLLDHLSELSSFYQGVIAILILVIGLLASLAFLTIKHVSKSAAEDVAVDAARRVVSDSNAFREDVIVIVDESVQDALVDMKLDELRSGMDEITKALARLEGRINELDHDGGVVAPD